MNEFRLENSSKMFLSVESMSTRFEKLKKKERKKERWACTEPYQCSNELDVRSFRPLLPSTNQLRMWLSYPVFGMEADSYRELGLHGAPYASLKLLEPTELQLVASKHVS